MRSRRIQRRRRRRRGTGSEARTGSVRWLGGVRSYERDGCIWLFSIFFSFFQQQVICTFSDRDTKTRQDGTAQPSFSGGEPGWRSPKSESMTHGHLHRSRDFRMLSKVVSVTGSVTLIGTHRDQIPRLSRGTTAQRSQRIHAELNSRMIPAGASVQAVFGGTSTPSSDPVPSAGLAVRVAKARPRAHSPGPVWGLGAV